MRVGKSMEKYGNGTERVWKNTDNLSDAQNKILDFVEKSGREAVGATTHVFIQDSTR